MRYIRPLLVICVLAGLTFVYFSDILLSEQIFTFRDLSRYYYPLRFFAFSQIKSGHFPFWNPYVASGHPLFAAVQSVVLYPVSIVYLLFNFDFAFNLFIILHIFLGGLFFYLLMRDLGFNHISGLISGLTFMFGGYLISVINLTTTLAAAIWFPLAFLFYNRTIQKKKFIYLVLTSIFLGFMFLGGEPTPFYATVLILGVYSLIYILLTRKDMLKIFAFFICVLIIFILLFSFQILPFIELIKLSNRNLSQFELSAHWSFPPRDIINLFLPFFYGPLHFQQDSPMRQDWLLLSYVGVIPLVLFLVSFLFKRDNLTSFFKLIFIIGLIFVFGKFSAFYALFYKFLPGFGLIRYPVKFFFVIAVSFSFLVGSGWQEYCQRIKQKDRRLLKFIKSLFIISFIAAITFLLLYIFKNQISSQVVAYLDRLNFKDKLYNLKYFTIFSVDLYNFRRLLVFFILGSLFLFVGARRKIPSAVVGVILSALIFIDLYGAKNIEVNPAISRKVLHKETPNIAFLKKDKSLFRIYTSYQMNKLNEALRGNTYEEAFINSIDSLTCNRLLEYGIYDARGYLSIHNLNYAKVLNLVDSSPLPSSTNVLNMLNVKYILTPKEIKDPRCKLVNKGLNTYLYENMDVLPRAYLVPDFVVLKNEIDIANKMKSKEFNPAKEVILEEEPSSIEPALPAGRHRASNIERSTETKEYVNIIRYEPNEVIIETNVLNKPRFLILADNYYPGWQVFVDGNKDKIYKANFILRGVYLSPGKHIVKFIFSPASFKIGSAISLATIFILITIIIFPKLSRKLPSAIT